jgi:hypothetical protein
MSRDSRQLCRANRTRPRGAKILDDHLSIAEAFLGVPAETIARWPASG